jgi:hypothetical protein
VDRIKRNTGSGRLRRSFPAGHWNGAEFSCSDRLFDEEPVGLMAGPNLPRLARLRALGVKLASYPRLASSASMRDRGVS